MLLSALAVLLVLCVGFVLRQNGRAATGQEQVLSCPVTGTVAHHHDDSCYDAEGNLACTLPEVERHVHDDSCYQEQRTLACGQEETAGHTHDDSCYDEEGNLTCGQEESAGHVHDDSCYRTERTLACGKEEVTEEHQHGPGCFAAAAEMPEQAFEHRFVDGDNKEVLTVLVDAPEGALPEGTTMEAKWVDTSKKKNAEVKAIVEETVAKKTDAEVAQVQAVDITFRDADGDEIEPARKVTVTFASPQIASEDTNQLLVHVESDREAQERAGRQGKDTYQVEGSVIEPLTAKQLEKRDLPDEADELVFDADQFSVYAVVYTVDFEPAQDGSGYESTVVGDGFKITVTCDGSAEIPEKAVLEAREILPESAAGAERGGDYDQYAEGAFKALGWETESLSDAQANDALSGLRLFDIKIVDENGQKVQPAPGAVVDVRIELTDGTENESPKVVHFEDGEDSGDVLESTTEETGDGQAICFATDGFSVYALVDEAKEPASRTVHGVETLEDLAQLAASGQGIYISHVSGYYFTNGVTTIKDPRKGITKTAKSTSPDLAEGAVPYYFEPAGAENQYYVYCEVGGAKKYICQSTNSMWLDEDPTKRTAFTVSKDGDVFRVAGTDGYYWNMQGGANGKSFAAYNIANDTNARIKFEYVDKLDDDPYGLDGHSFGIAYDAESLFCTALMAGEGGSIGTKDIVKLDTKEYKDNLFVSSDSDITEWTFHKVEEDRYYITSPDGKYLTISDGSVTLSDAPTENSQIRVVPGTGANSGSYTFAAGGVALDLAGTEDNRAFTGSADGGTRTRFKLAEKTFLTEDDYLIYTAQKISVSDPVDQVVLYTRVWNGSQYEFYAVDHDGSLIRCYDDGDVIKWVGNQYQTALWQLTEHTKTDEEGNKVPNGYYELQNTYSDKYISPQLGTNTSLSGSESYLQLDGRYYQEDYSKIRCWDDSHYAYIGLKVDLENKRVVPCPSNQADDFYFARIKTNSPHLTEVATVDNNEFGITMKMIDFNNPIKNNRDSVQTEYFGLDSNKAGLLTTDIKNGGYPVSTTNEISLDKLFAGDQTVNHLFIQSVYDESGYFEYDSTKNFAYLNGTDFEVYDQLATTERPSNTNTSRHGQFMPYNSLIDPVTKEPWPYSEMYTNTTTVTGAPMSTDAPRYGEGLHEIPLKQADYFFGMEMSANFTQTPSGLDAWGHDIIFEFSGDDDFWLYVDDELVLDLGGVHSAMTGSVNFRTGVVTGRNGTRTLREIFESNYRQRNHEATDADVAAYLNRFFEDGGTVFKDYSTHSMKIFYMERGAGASNLHMRFNLTAVKKGEVTLSKKVTGSDDVDYDLMEFPYKILYRLKGDTDPAETHDIWTELTQNENDPAVTYQGSKRPVRFADSYTPVGETEPCTNVFFLKPGEIASINMPADVVDYKIVECGVNMNIFRSVKANNKLLSGEGDSGRHDYQTDSASIEDRPEVQFENDVDPHSLRTLTVTKVLWDEHGFTVTGEGTENETKVGTKLVGYDGDETTFDLRISMSSSESEDPVPVNGKLYYVKDPNGQYCRWDVETGRFASLGISDYNKLVQTRPDLNGIAFETSPSGAVSKIPAGYSIEFRGLPVDSVFKVQEYENEIPAGYSLVEYERDKGSYISEADNQGIIRANEDPHVMVHNKRGWGLTVKKVWSDADFMQSHDDIYFAVYVRNSETGDLSLLDGSVRKLTSPATSLYYYFDSLQEGATFDDYEIYEVKLTDPGENGDGAITYSGIERIEDGGRLTIGGTPKGKAHQDRFTYEASYAKGTATGGHEGVQNVRKDTVTNTRTGIRLVKTDWNGSPLPGAVFTLTDSQGATVGADTFTSDQDGLITIAYLDPETYYTLTETKAPSGFQKPSEPWMIRVDGDGTISVTKNGDRASFDVTQATADEMGTVTIKNKGFSLAAVKVGEGKSALSGAVFALYKQVVAASGQVRDQSPMEGYETLTTGANGLIPGVTSALPAGVYYLSEVTPPSGYKQLPGDLVFTVSSKGTVEIPSHVTSADAASLVILNNLTGADAPNVSGWLSSSESEGHKTYTITIPNELEGVPVRIIKTDQLGNALEGARFSFVGEGINETGLVSAKEEGEADALIYENPALGVGTYKLTETGTPDGYLAPETPVTVTVESIPTGINVTASIGDTQLDSSKVSFDSETGVWTIKIMNQTGAELPAAGGLGNGITNILGAMAISAVVFTNLLLRRRKMA